MAVIERIRTDKTYKNLQEEVANLEKQMKLVRSAKTPV